MILSLISHPLLLQEINKPPRLIRAFMFSGTMEQRLQQSIASWLGIWGNMALQFCWNHWIFGDFTELSESFQTFAAGKHKGFDFYQKIIELAPPQYSIHNTTLSWVFKLLVFIISYNILTNGSLYSSKTELKFNKFCWKVFHKFKRI